MNDNAAVTTTTGQAGTGQTGAVAPGAAGAAGAAAAGAGAAAGPWYQSMTSDAALRQTIQAKGFENFDALGKSYLDLQVAVGKKGVIVPGENATLAERVAALRQFGAPDTADKYEIPALEGVTYSEGDKAFQAAIRAKAHELGVPAFAIKELAGVFNAEYKRVSGALAAATGAAQKAGETERDAVFARWGADKDKNVALAQTAFQTFYPKDSAEADKLEALMGTGTFLDHFQRIGMVIGEEGGRTIAAGGFGGGAMTPEQATSEIDKIMTAARADPKHAYLDERHPEHKALHQRVATLHAMAAPGFLKNAD